MNTKDKGNIGEAQVVADLLQQGIQVALPFGDNLPFDLIAIGPDLCLWKVQVKYACVYRGVLRIRNSRMSENTRRRYDQVYTPMQVDVFAVFCPDTQQVYYVSYSEVSARAIFHLRVTETQNQQSIGVHWHGDYRSFRDASETRRGGPEMAKI
jgi:hypothetical protein